MTATLKLFGERDLGRVVVSPPIVDEIDGLAVDDCASLGLVCVGQDRFWCWRTSGYSLRRRHWRLPEPFTQTTSTTASPERGNDRTHFHAGAWERCEPLPESNSTGRNIVADSVLFPEGILVEYPCDRGSSPISTMRYPIYEVRIYGFAISSLAASMSSTISMMVSNPAISSISLTFS